MTEVFKQLKYAFKHGVSVRYISFGIVLAINAVFGFLALSGVLGFAASVTAVSLSGTGLGAVVITNIIADIQSLGAVFGSPSGYTYALTPVKSSKILFARISAIVIQDVVTIAVNIVGTVWLSFYLAGMSAIEIGDLLNMSGAFQNFVGFIFEFIQYLYIFTLIIFCVILRKSVFFTSKIKTLLAVLCGIAVYWILSFLDFLLLPFAAVDGWFMFYNITVFDEFGMLIFAGITLLKAAVLFIASSKLMERRINF
jgi:hypothetical protein